MPSHHGRLSRQLSHTTAPQRAAENRWRERASAATSSSGIGFSSERRLSLRNGSGTPAISAQRRPSATSAGGSAITTRRRPPAPRRSARRSRAASWEPRAPRTAGRRPRARRAAIATTSSDRCSSWVTNSRCGSAADHRHQRASRQSPDHRAEQAACADAEHEPGAQHDAVALEHRTLELELRAPVLRASALERRQRGDHQHAPPSLGEAVEQRQASGHVDRTDVRTLRRGVVGGVDDRLDAVEQRTARAAPRARSGARARRPGAGRRTSAIASIPLRAQVGEDAPADVAVRAGHGDHRRILARRRRRDPVRVGHRREGDRPAGNRRKARAVDDVDAPRGARAPKRVALAEAGRRGHRDRGAVVVAAAGRGDLGQRRQRDEPDRVRASGSSARWKRRDRRRPSPGWARARGAPIRCSAPSCLRRDRSRRCERSRSRSTRRRVIESSVGTEQRS